MKFPWPAFLILPLELDKLEGYKDDKTRFSVIVPHNEIETDKDSTK